MNQWFGYGSRAIVSVALLLAGISALPNTASAQYEQTRQTYENIRLRRAVRSLERRQLAVPAQQRQQVQQLRRDLNRSNSLNSNRQQISRQLDRIERDLATPLEQPVQRPPLIPSKSAALPSSTDTTAYLPSFGRPLRNAIGMIDRAEIALAEGRIHQARSDLSTAGRELASASADTDEEAAAIELSAERIAGIEAQLADN